MEAEVEEQPGTLVGYVVMREGNELILSNIPTISTSQQVFQFGPGEEIDVDGFTEGEDGESSAPVMRGAFIQAAPPESTDGESEATENETEEETEAGEGDEAADDEEAAEGEGTFVMAGDAPAAGGVWVSSADEGAAELPTTDEPLELHQLRLAGDVPGHEVLVPGLKVRVHFEGEGEDRVVARVELIQVDAAEQQ